MARKPMFQDIVPPDRKSIKKIPIPERNPRLPEPEPVIPRRKKKRRLGRWFFILIILAALIGGGLYVANPDLSGATVEIKPRTQTVTVDASFTARKDESTEGLHYQTATIAKDGKLAVAGTEDEFVQTKAAGVIIIYNNFNTEPQLLIAGTRFQTDKGLIFRINQPVTVPGKKIVDGESVPGSAEAVITADKTGPDYNIGLADFTIPGFKGDARFDKFFARSKVPVQGGFSGNRKKISKEDLENARTRVRNELEANLARQAEKDIPTGFVLPKGSYYIEYESLADTPEATGVMITERATYHGIMFNSTELGQEINKKLDTNTALVYSVASAENLTIGLKHETSTSTKPWEAQTLSFTLKVSTSLVSVVDTEKLRDELIGKPRNSLNAILSTHPSIEKAEVTIRPFWNSSFPLERDKITVIIDRELTQD